MTVSRSFVVLLLAAATPTAAEVEPALSVEWGSPLRLSANLGVRIGSAPAGEGAPSGDDSPIRNSAPAIDLAVCINFSS